MKKISLFDVAIGSLAATGVVSKLNYFFNSSWKQTDLISTIGFGIASIIAGCVIGQKCAEFSAETREKIEFCKYASPKGE